MNGIIFELEEKSKYTGNTNRMGSGFKAWNRH